MGTHFCCICAHVWRTWAHAVYMGTMSEIDWFAALNFQMLLSIFSSRVKSEFTLMEIATAQPTVDSWQCMVLYRYSGHPWWPNHVLPFGTENLQDSRSSSSSSEQPSILSPAEVDFYRRLPGSTTWLGVILSHLTLHESLDTTRVTRTQNESLDGPTHSVPPTPTPTVCLFVCFVCLFVLFVCLFVCMAGPGVIDVAASCGWLQRHHDWSLQLRE